MQAILKGAYIESLAFKIIFSLADQRKPLRLLLILAYITVRKIWVKRPTLFSIRYTIDINVFSFPFTASIISCPLLQGLSLPAVVSDSISSAVFSDLEFKD